MSSTPLAYPIRDLQNANGPREGYALVLRRRPNRHTHEPTEGER